ncbi:uncharacterized protein METZ01_LOCUS278616, partial [marine metagenome]
MSNNRIPIHSILGSDVVEKISVWAEKSPTISELVEFLSLEFQIDITSDLDIVNGYERDCSNINGNAEVLCRPINELECALVLRCCQSVKIPQTISAGRTNLTGSATPKRGVILSIEKMT